MDLINNKLLNCKTRTIINSTKQVCWATSIYKIPAQTGSQLPASNEAKWEVSYYQWVPLILTLQAMLFALPRIIWKLLSKKSGVSVSSIVDAAIQFQRQTDPIAAGKSMTFMTKYMVRFLLDFRRDSPCGATGMRCGGRCGGCYLVAVYLVVKVLYITNSVGQHFVFNVVQSFVSFVID